MADYAVDLVRSYVTPISQVDLDRLRSLLAEVDDEATKELAPAGLPAGAVHTERFVLMAYSGQNSAMSVPCPEGAAIAEAGLLDLAERFHHLHESDRGFAFRNQQPQLRGVRLLARGITPKPERLAVLGTETSSARASAGRRPVHFGAGFVDTPLVDGALLGAGFTVEGPCLIQEPFTVVAVWPGWQASLEAHGSYVLIRT